MRLKEFNAPTRIMKPQSSNSYSRIKNSDEYDFTKTYHRTANREQNSYISDRSPITSSYDKYDKIIRMRNQTNLNHPQTSPHNIDNLENCNLFQTMFDMDKFHNLSHLKTNTKKTKHCTVAQLHMIGTIKDKKTAQRLTYAIEEDAANGLDLNQITELLTAFLKKNKVKHLTSNAVHNMYTFLDNTLNPNNATILALYNSVKNTGHVTTLYKNSNGQMLIVDAQKNKIEEDVNAYFHRKGYDMISFWCMQNNDKNNSKLIKLSKELMSE